LKASSYECIRSRPPGLEPSFLADCTATAAAKDVLKKSAFALRIEDRTRCAVTVTFASFYGCSGRRSQQLSSKRYLKNYNGDEDRDNELAACVCALQHNQGLVEFTLCGHVVRSTDRRITFSQETPCPRTLNLYLSSVTAFRSRE
jgi:hypothetical protein